MNIKSILVSQPKPKSDKNPFHDLAKKYSLKVDFRSFIHVDGVHPKDFRQQRIDMSSYSAVIFTSRMAIDHYFRIAKQTRFTVLIIFLNSINSSYLKKVIFLLLFAVSSPLGGVFGEFVVNIDFFRGFSFNLLAVSCGMLLHITTLLIFEDHHNSKGKIKNILTISVGILTGILIFSF